MYYVHIIGSYDDTFIGGFASIDAAAAYLRTVDRNTFSAYILTEADFHANVAKYGPVTIEQVSPCQ
jgi:hypothetical protein